MNIQFYELLNFFIQKINNRLLLNGYLEHFVIGALIGSLVFHYVFRNSAALKSCIIALVLVAAIGLAKELIDPYLGRQKDKIDLVSTVLGGIIGIGIIFLFTKKD